MSAHDSPVRYCIYRNRGSSLKNRGSRARYWVRTSDLFRVKEARYRCANRAYIGYKSLSGGGDGIRTRVYGFAGRCLASRPPHHIRRTTVPMTGQQVVCERTTGFEPATSTLARWRSSQLSYVRTWCHPQLVSCSETVSGVMPTSDYSRPDSASMPNRGQSECLKTCDMRWPSAECPSSRVSAPPEQGWQRIVPLASRHWRSKPQQRHEQQRNERNQQHGREPHMT